MGLHFTPTSFFPRLQLTDILEIEFQMTYALGIPFSYNNMEYYEFIWRYERLATERDMEIEAKKNREGNMSLSNIGNIAR